MRGTTTGGATNQRGRHAVALLVIAVLAVAAAPALRVGATAAVTTGRLQGADRYSTAGAVAAAKFPSGVDTAVVASGVNYPDALAGAYLAGVDNATVLLTDPGAVPSGLAQALGALHVRHVILLGGAGAISTAVEQQLGATASTAQGGGPLQVSRVWGTTRYDTMQAIDTVPPASGVDVVGGLRTAVLASGANYPDALAASAAAYGKRLPTVLTDPGALSRQAMATMQQLAIAQVVIMGGLDAVSSAVEQAVNAAGIATLRRFAGTDRTDTAQQFATWETGSLGFDTSEVTLARGDDFADALSGSQYAGDPKVLVLTQSPAVLGGPTTGYLSGAQSRIGRITAFGGNGFNTGASGITDATLHAAAVAAGQGAAVSGTTTTTTRIGGGGGGPPAPRLGSSAVPTGAPDLQSVTVSGPNNYFTGGTTTVSYAFDKPMSVAAPVSASFHLVGSPTNGGTSASPSAPCSYASTTVVTCPFASNVSAFTAGAVDSGAVTGTTPAALTNPLGAVAFTAPASINPGFGGFPGPLLSGVSIDPVANTITYTFAEPVATACGPPLCPFGFVDASGLDHGATGLTGFVPGSTTAVATYATPADPVSSAVQSFVAATGAAAADGVLSAPTAIGGPVGTSRATLLSVSFVAGTNPPQYDFAFDQPVTPDAVGAFALYSRLDGSLATGAALVGQPSTSVVRLTMTGVTSNNAGWFTLGAVDEGAAHVTGGGFGSTTTMGSRPVSGAPFQLAGQMAGPILTAASGVTATATMAFTFSSPFVCPAAGAAGNFFVLNSTATPTYGATISGCSGRTVQVVMAGAIGGTVAAGVASTLGFEGTATGAAVTDANGNDNAPTVIPAATG